MTDDKRDARKALRKAHSEAIRRLCDKGERALANYAARKASDARLTSPLQKTTDFKTSNKEGS